jgi:hypothetical protein
VSSAKTDRKLAELRPRSRDLVMALYLPQPIRDPRITRIVAVDSPRVIHLLMLRTVDDVDEQLRDWLTEAFLHATDPPRTARSLGPPSQPEGTRIGDAARRPHEQHRHPQQDPGTIKGAQ